MIGDKGKRWPSLSRNLHVYYNKLLDVCQAFCNGNYVFVRNVIKKLKYFYKRIFKLIKIKD
nr:MAG TPA: hypothetical protein [Caudoviricetes sp.]